MGYASGVLHSADFTTVAISMADLLSDTLEGGYFVALLVGIEAFIIGRGYYRLEY